MAEKRIRIKSDWLGSMAYPFVDEKQQQQILLVLDHVGDLRIKPQESPLVVKLPAGLGGAIFGELPDTGGAIHGVDLRDRTFPFFAIEKGAGVILTGNGNYEISGLLLRELFEESAS